MNHFGPLWTFQIFMDLCEHSQILLNKRPRDLGMGATTNTQLTKRRYFQLTFTLPKNKKVGFKNMMEYFSRRTLVLGLIELR
jgi:hypothetical protein